MISDISVMIAGIAGDGVLFTGNVLAKILKREGWEVVSTRDFPSNIRGEPTNYTIRARLKKIYGRSNSLDVLMAFDCQAILSHIKRMADQGVLLCDGEDVVRISPSEGQGKTFHEFPLRRMAKDHFGDEIFKNMIALGALCYILDLETSVVEEVIFEAFLKKKGMRIVQKNIQALKLGCEQAKKTIAPGKKHSLKKRKDTDRLLISGDEAIAFGALSAGCRFFAAYPICPASEIWQWLVKYFPLFNGVVVQTEDELAAINMALGASYAGVRAMTSTSGPGASLMMEGLSLSGITEIPIVIVHVQRAGPSTGMPTKNEQADLNQWVYGAHGDFPRVVLSPGTIEECFQFTIKAFNIAEKYQIPVIMLTEQDYGQNLRTVKTFDLAQVKINRGKLLTQKDLLNIKDYKRYEFTSEGVSPRVIPGMKSGIHMVESNEHDEKGYRDEDPTNRVRMMEKRMKKLRSVSEEVVPPKIWGEKEAEVGIIGFGSTFGPIREAMEKLQVKGVKTKYLQMRTIWPFPSKKVEAFTSGCREVFVVENNYSGQLSFLIRSQVSHLPKVRSILDYSGLPFRPLDIMKEIEKAL